MRFRRSFGRAVALVSVGSVVATAVLARSSELLIATIVVGTMAWGSAPQAIDAWWGRQPRRPPVSRGVGTFSILIPIQGTVDELARTTITAAASCGPTIVVTTRAEIGDDLATTGQQTVVADTVEAGLVIAASVCGTDAILVLSTGSFVDRSAAQIAAGFIGDGFDWVTARSRPFNRDGFSPLVRARIGSQLRASARAGGAVLWEPNATMLSRQAVLQHRFVPGRAWGSVLRTIRRAGGSGIDTDLTVSLSAEPVDSRSHWQSAIVRRRRAVADLADALATTRGRSRVLTAGLLLRELDGVVLTVWLLCPWLLTRPGTFAFDAPIWALALLVGGSAALRWLALRVGRGGRPHPLDDLLAMAFDAPVSMLAVPTALTGRVRPSRVRMPSQPLALALAVFVAIDAVPLFAGGTTARRSTAVGLALTELALLWLLAMRVLFQRNWTRTTYRIRASLPATVGEVAGTTIDIAPTGAAIAGRFDPGATGSSVEIVIDCAGGDQVHARGRIEGMQSRAGLLVAGVSFRVDAGDQTRWVQQLCRSMSVNPATVRRPPGAGRPSAWRVAAVALIGSITAVAAAALVLALLGYRPVVVRSASMEPALRVGDVVLVEDVDARALRTGDIATVDSVAGVSDSLTHRVERVAVDGARLTLVVRGDANQTAETLTMAVDSRVGRVTARFAGIGLVVVRLGNSWIRLAGAVVGIALLLDVAVSGRRTNVLAYPAQR